MDFNSPTSGLFRSLDLSFELPTSSDDAQSPSPAAAKRKAANVEDKRANKLSRGKNWNEDDFLLLITAIFWNEKDKKRSSFPSLSVHSN